MGSNFEYAGCVNLFQHFQNDDTSFGYVTEDTHMNQMTLYANGQYDFDVIEEHLGEKHPNIRKRYFERNIFTSQL